MLTLAQIRKHLRRDPTAAMMIVAVGIVSLGTAIQTTDLIPLAGQATPTYGSMPAPKAVSSRAASSRKSNSSKSSRASRKSTSSVAVHPAAAASSSKTSAWTGTECPGYGLPPEACAAKMRALLKGDYSCYKDTKCVSHLGFVCSLGGDCPAIQIREWTYDALFPKCLESGNAECLAGANFLTGPSAPADVKTCLSSVLCRELFATFLKGEFTCRRYEPCLNALDALLASPTCAEYGWCRNMRSMNSIYNNDSRKCPAIETVECRLKLGIYAYAEVTQRRSECHQDVDCFDALSDLTERLINGPRVPGEQVTPACFLWKDCKAEFEASKRWACSTPKREPQCGNSTRIWEYLTVTNKACVTSGESDRCQNDLKTLRK